jgi:hypothetical protein
VTEVEPEWVLDTPDPQATRDAIARLTAISGGAEAVATLRNAGFTEAQIASMSLGELTHRLGEAVAQGVTPDGRKRPPPPPIPERSGKSWGTAIGAAVGLAVIIMLVLNHNAGIERDIASKKAKASEKEEIALLSDPTRGPAEIDRRLRDRMSIRSGVLTIIEDPDGVDVYSLPVETRWLVSCNLGVVISFGRGPDGDAVVNVSHVFPSPDECETIVPLVGERVRALLAAAE